MGNKRLFFIVSLAIIISGVSSFSIPTIVTINTQKNQDVNYTYTYVVFSFDAQCQWTVSSSGDVDATMTLINNLQYVYFSNLQIIARMHEWNYITGQWVHTKNVPFSFGTMEAGATKVVSVSTTCAYATSTESNDVDFLYSENDISYGSAYDLTTEQIVTSKTKSPVYNDPYEGRYTDIDIVDLIGGLIVLGIVGGSVYWVINRFKGKKERPSLPPSSQSSQPFSFSPRPAALPDFLLCPECRSPAMKIGINKYACSKCNSIFMIREKP